MIVRVERIIRLFVVPFLSVAAMFGVGYSLWTFNLDDFVLNADDILDGKLAVEICGKCHSVCLSSLMICETARGASSCSGRAAPPGSAPGARSAAARRTHRYAAGTAAAPPA